MPFDVLIIRLMPVRHFDEMVTIADDCNSKYRAINEGRMAARDVDTYLTGMGTQLPVTGGIVKRPPYELLMHKGANGAVPELVTTAA